MALWLVLGRYPTVQSESCLVLMLLTVILGRVKAHMASYHLQQCTCRVKQGYVRAHAVQWDTGYVHNLPRLQRTPPKIPVIHSRLMSMVELAN